MKFERLDSCGATAYRLDEDGNPTGPPLHLEAVSIDFSPKRHGLRDWFRMWRASRQCARRRRKTAGVYEMEITLCSTEARVLGLVGDDDGRS